MSFNFFKKLLIGAACIGISSISLATPVFHYKDCVGNANYGYTKINASYDEPRTTFTWKFSSPASIDGFWLVVTLGENALTTRNKHVIFYGDGKNKKVTAYAYDSTMGTNGTDSFKDDNKYIGSFDLFYDGSGNFRFDVHTAILNSLEFGRKFSNEWSGAVFGRQDIYYNPINRDKYYISFAFQTLSNSNYQYSGERIRKINFANAKPLFNLPRFSTHKYEACEPDETKNEC